MPSIRRTVLWSTASAMVKRNSTGAPTSPISCQIVGTVTFIFAYIPTVFVWGHISIVLHELGHFYAAKVLGMEPIRIKVGAGPRLAAFEFFGRPIDYFLVPTYGTTYVSIGTLRRLRTKLVLLS